MNLKDKKAADTRQRFITAARELFLEKGFGPTSMNQVAQRAGGSRANLYLHFRNKPDLMLALMQEIEPGIRAPIREVFDLPEHTMESIMGWLGDMATLWREHSVEFSSIEQAMAEDAVVANEWLDMLRRLSNSIPELEDNEERRFQFIISLMSLDRNFYFLYVRNQDTNEELVHRCLARQWLTVFEV